ncbi:hypothetical protein DI487_07290 [Flavobacterium sediminis]|uniref:Uncharacterized protein n=1 Tax=Flavobacterium sediminis TaxID=2201181 RepID=A0A2U8QUZ4_9FLAO|nr:hypothetical protein [Flavobacterium sediminis]AWM13684.1 hypothetical protein DI487_07290 [Flavobacterium sediminis]
MKLTKENIVLVDNYLQNNGVVYYDIRMEMVDHVATAVEEKMKAEHVDFEEAFENFIFNKGKLFKKINSEATKRAGNKAKRILLKRFYLPSTILVAFGSLALLFGINFLWDSDLSFDVYSVVYMVFIIRLALVYLYKNFSGKYRFKRIAVVDKMIGFYALSTYLLNYVFRVDKHIDSEYIRMVFFALIIVYSWVVYQTSLTLEREYKQYVEL